MIIYCITNKINDKKYIGQTIQSLTKRWKQHIYRARTSNEYFASAIRKHGSENFSIEILESVNTKELLNEREQYWINFYNSFGEGYNTTSGGERNWTHSKESLRKMSESQLGRAAWNKGIPQTEKQKEDHSLIMKEKYSSKILINPRKGVQLTDETKQRMRLAKLGKPKSEEHKRNMSKARQNYLLSQTPNA